MGFPGLKIADILYVGHGRIVHEWESTNQTQDASPRGRPEPWRFLSKNSSIFERNMRGIGWHCADQEAVELGR
jgi:hypothetical protein